MGDARYILPDRLEEYLGSVRQRRKAVGTVRTSQETW